MVEDTTIELATHLIVGISPYRTFKVVGKISGHKVLILIDYDAHHNFISTELARKFNLPILPTKKLG